MDEVEAADDLLRQLGNFAAPNGAAAIARNHGIAAANEAKAKALACDAQGALDALRRARGYLNNARLAGRMLRTDGGLRTGVARRLGIASSRRVRGEASSVARMSPMPHARESHRERTAGSRRRQAQAVQSGGDEPPGEPPPGFLQGRADEIAFAFDAPSLTFPGFHDALCEREVPMGDLHRRVFALLPDAHQDAAWSALQAEENDRWALDLERAS